MAPSRKKLKVESRSSLTLDQVKALSQQDIMGLDSNDLKKALFLLECPYGGTKPQPLQMRLLHALNIEPADENFDQPNRFDAVRVEPRAPLAPMDVDSEPVVATPISAHALTAMTLSKRANALTERELRLVPPAKREACLRDYVPPAVNNAPSEFEKLLRLCLPAENGQPFEVLKQYVDEPVYWSSTLPRRRLTTFHLKPKCGHLALSDSGKRGRIAAERLRLKMCPRCVVQMETARRRKGRQRRGPLPRYSSETKVRCVENMMLQGKSSRQVSAQEPLDRQPDASTVRRWKRIACKPGNSLMTLREVKTGGKKTERKLAGYWETMEKLAKQNPVAPDYDLAEQLAHLQPTARDRFGTKNSFINAVSKEYR